MLRSLASVMQRERTALKVMQQMLVSRRDTLTVDDVVPVGDSFDYIVQGQDPLDPQAAALFRSANALYREKLRPIMLAENSLTEGDAAGDPGRLPDAFRAQDRLAKTLLLSAVAPKVPALKELTAARLASLNHGSIKSPLPGSEAGIVLAKVKEWSRRVPEIHISGDPRNPVIRVQLADVDYESVVENAKGEDNDGRRRELIKDLVRDALGVTARDADVFGAYAHPVTWRGSRRLVDLVFGNVRDSSWLTEDHFRARPGTWRVVIDHPFDDAGHSPTEDLARVDRMTEGGLKSRTIVWLPRFLSEERMRDVRRLVILDWLLGGTGERWTANADHLSEVDRAQARAILESQQTGLREGLRRAVQECYGAAAPTPGTLADDAAHDRVLISLDASFAPASPVGADLAAAFGNLIDQAFTATYPGHPRFEPADVEVTVRDLAAVYAHVERAVADQDGRVRLEGDIAAVRRVANALQVGAAGETHFLFGDDRFGPWGAEFERAAARDGLQPQDTVRVGQLRGWIDAMRPESGLRDEVADLVMLAWAALRQRAWYQHGASIPAPRPGATRPDMELRPEPLPVPADWQAATSRAEILFGIRANPYLTAAGVAEFTETLRKHVDVLADDAVALVQRVELAYTHLGLPPGRPGRLATARAGAELAEALRRASSRVHLVETLAHAALPSTETAVAKSLSSAAAVAAAASGFRWERLAPLRAAEEPGRRARPVRRQHAGDPARCGSRRRVHHPAGSRRSPPPTMRSSTGWQAATPAEARRARPGRRNIRVTIRPGRRQAGPGDPGQGRRGGQRARPADGVPGRAPRRGCRGGVAGAGVTATLARATVPVLRALLDQARRKDYKSGVLGVRARPEWPGAQTFTHADVPVRVVPCVSALAVREALLDRVRSEWLVVLTDRPDDDLGAGVLSHLVWNRLRTPDPWDAVRDRFAANGIDPALTGTADDREIAIGLLTAAPVTGWPPAPGGVLTRDHALGSVAAAHLGLTDPALPDPALAGPVIDAASVLAWMAGPAVIERVADLRALAGDALTGAVLDWAAGRAGAIGQPLLHLLRAGEARDAVPLGLVAGLLGEVRDGAAGQATQPGPEPARLAPVTAARSAESMQLAREALIRLEPRLGGVTPAAAVLRPWARESSAVIAGLLRDPAGRASAEALLARADELLAGVRAAGLADGSDLLPSGLTRRFAALASALRAAVAGAAMAGGDPDLPQVTGDALAEAERAWTRVATHRLAGADPRTRAFHAAIRLTRWLAANATAGGTSLQSLLGRHSSNDAWADSAVNDAAAGTSDPDLGSGLAAVLAAVRTRRAAHDLAFAAALAAHTSDDPAAAPADHGKLSSHQRP